MKPIIDQQHFTHDQSYYHPPHSQPFSISRRKPFKLIAITIFIIISTGLIFIFHSTDYQHQQQHLFNQISQDYYQSNYDLELFNFTSLPDYFIQDDPSQNSNHFNVYHPHSSFGLIDSHSPHRWAKFKRAIDSLTAQSPNGQFHKVIFIARHGQGFHNLAESKYGVVLWDCHWSTERTDGNLVWGPDARLTDLGKSEAQSAQQAWMRELKAGAPIPEIFITSPLSRAIETLMITGVWNQSTTSQPTITVQENWRENIGLHTCDQRRSKNEISNDFPFVGFEHGFSQQDKLWTEDLQETNKQLDIRIKQSLTSLFLDPPTSNKTYISITAHSGVISSLLRVIGHRPWPTETGGMIPLVIRASLVKTPTRPSFPGPSASRPTCPPALTKI